MLTFLLDNIGTIVVLLIVVAVVAAIIISKEKGQIFLWQLWLRMCILCNGR